ncbi:MAG: glycosyltransferase family 2 protein [Clostridium paraputrificum]|uniref:glycosyltransferase family 2 protein n=1 Tax=Clostridium paraputrificum TaxID=29363 RepID=UPI000C07FA14|nr:glycosyltransferase family 2 protein [Clostridium paraputrificum]MDB2087489.1 glycosyltransferase family 2 protein [Clostridium paraputrificum]SQB86126.1 glycosyl transferase family protein [Clostridium paraputrificum]
MEIIFWLCVILIIHSFIGYPISLKIINKIAKKDKISIDSDYCPFVTIVIPAHNEELVIESKLENITHLNYPSDKLEIIIASDNSTDSTNEIIKKFCEKSQFDNLRLYEVKERKGKTNAQNEAVKIANGEIIVFSDANSILKNDSVYQLVKYFSDDDVAYVSGRLVYINNNISETSEAENSYWNYDLMMREYESNISSITAGNGAIYAIRKKDYINLDPMYCHDSMMPIKSVICNKKAKYNKDAIAYEKAGETAEDEFKRKIRMARKNIAISYSDIQKYNPFKCGWFSYFYFCHRYLRNSLFILHLLLYISSLVLFNEGIVYYVAFIGQTIFYILSILGIKNKSKMFYLPYYYTLTIVAQLKGAINEVSGKSKPFWEKAESTR